MAKITKISLDIAACTPIDIAVAEAYELSKMNVGALVEITFNDIPIQVKFSGEGEAEYCKYITERINYYYKWLEIRREQREKQERSLKVPVADVLELVELSQVSQKRGRWLDTEISRANKIVGKMPTEYQAKFRSTMELPLNKEKIK